MSAECNSIIFSHKTPKLIKRLIRFVLLAESITCADDSWGDADANYAVGSCQ